METTISTCNSNKKVCENINSTRNKNLSDTERSKYQTPDKQIHLNNGPSSPVLVLNTLLSHMTNERLKNI